MAENFGRRSLGEQYYNQVSDSIKSVYELTTRIDERVQLMMRSQDILSRKMEQSDTNQQQHGTDIAILKNKENETKEIKQSLDKLQTSVANIERKVDDLEGKSTTAAKRWGKAIGVIIQIAQCLIVAYLIWKLGWK